MTLTTRLRTAATYLQEHGWTQGTEQDGDGHVCLTGAIRYCAPIDGDTYLIREVLRKRDRAESWNDDDAREEDEVLTLLQTFEITDADLADTFGPQWSEIVVLVRRAAAFTPDEGKQLAAAGSPAWSPAGSPAWSPAGSPAWSPAGTLAWAAASAAGTAAWDAAWDAASAARDAAGALVIRDLIGQHGYTQAHYDRLTGPWRRVVGKVHPDDADVSA